MTPANRAFAIGTIDEAAFSQKAYSTFFRLSRFAAIVQELFDLPKPPSAEWCRETLKLVGSVRETRREDIWEYREYPEYPSYLQACLRRW